MVQLRIYVNFRKSIRRLSYEEKGQLFDAMLAYAEDETLLPLSGRADAIWDFVQQMLDAQHKAYEAKCENMIKARGQNPCNNELKSANKKQSIGNNELKSVEDNLSLSNFEVQEQVQIQEQIQDKKYYSQEKKQRKKRDFEERSVTDEDFKDLFLPLDEEIKK